MNTPKQLLHLLAVVAVAAHAWLATPAHAKDAIAPEKLAAAKEVMTAVGAARQIQFMGPLILGQMERAFVQLKPGLKDELGIVFRKLQEKFSDQANELVDKIAEIYAAEFSVEDLNAISGFYRSEVGRRFVEKQPQLMKQGATIGRKWGEELGREIDREVRAEMKARGHEL